MCQAALQTFVQHQDVPQVKLQRFKGDPAEYPGFITSFESLVKSKVKDSAHLFHTLIEYCESEALALVQDFRVLPPDQGYMEAMDVLRIHYGQAHLVARSLIESLKNFPHLDDDKNEGLGKKLLKFSTKLINVQATLKSYKREADINSSETIKILVAKLPQFGINEWKKAAARINEKGEGARSR